MGAFMNLLPIPVAVCGALGRMGRRVIDAVASHPRLSLTGAVEYLGHPDTGKDVGILTGQGAIEVKVLSDFNLATQEAKVYIDFTNPAAAMENLKKAREKGLAVVIGTTGLSAEDQLFVKQASKDIPVLWAPNMSLGVNLMYKVAELIAKSLGRDFDIEIVEAHHRLKKDAPSGTALKLHEVLSKARNLDPQASIRTGRTGQVGERTDDEIGVLAVRGGDIVGDHTVLFAGPGERLELIHRAHSRDTFAAGAVRSAVWIFDKNPGLYSISDVLGL
jgi:4-hydroxy-tetrahydrodipicolinate reductase